MRRLLPVLLLFFMACETSDESAPQDSSEEIAHALAMADDLGTVDFRVSCADEAGEGAFATYIEVDRLILDGRIAWAGGLEIWPNRYRSLLGAARTAEAAGDGEIAREHHQTLISFVAEESDRPGVNEARSAAGPSK